MAGRIGDCPKCERWIKTGECSHCLQDKLDLYRAIAGKLGAMFVEAEVQLDLLRKISGIDPELIDKTPDNESTEEWTGLCPTCGSDDLAPSRRCVTCLQEQVWSLQKYVNDIEEDRCRSAQGLHGTLDRAYAALREFYERREDLALRHDPEDALRILETHNIDPAELENDKQGESQ